MGETPFACRELWPVLALALLGLPVSGAPTQEEEKPILRAGRLPEELVLDGVLDEPAWAEADAIENLTMVDPDEGNEPTERTTVRVLAGPAALVIGVRCLDSKPDGIVSRSMERDASLRGEDYVQIVLDTFLDGRTGYVFTVNPSGARRDSLVARHGEREDRSWDGIWEARTSRDEGGWSVEIRIPVLTLSFREGLTTWHFNVERNLERLQERSRWASPKRDYEITQTSRAGRLTDLPEFNLGLGLSVRPSAVASYGRTEVDDRTDFDLDGSLDVTQRLSAQLLASLTIHTDFSETEVDRRQTNLTRFPLFFPEKRTFFLEGSDLFQFGSGLIGRRRVDLAPFHSRRIGLVGGREVPLVVGGKLSGRVGDTSIGALAVRMDEEKGVAPETTMGVIRIKQDVLEESSIGMLATVGDPLDRDDSWMAGADFAYQTSRFMGDKNFLFGGWVLTMDREDLEGASRTAAGGKIGYPNDVLDLSLSYKMIGQHFDPSLSFVRRSGVHQFDLGAQVQARPDWAWLRLMEFGASPRVVTDLDGRLESYRVHASPVDLELESGDGIKIHPVWEGDRPPEDFEVSDGVIVTRGSYDWLRAHAFIRTASRRAVSGYVFYEDGDYYDGRLIRLSGELAWNPVPLVTVSGEAERNIGRLEGGDFRQDRYSGRLRLNVSPDLNVSTFVQFDTESRNLGSFSRLRWQITPVSELFLVYSYNWQEAAGSLAPQTFESAVKVQYAIRF